eukprot:2814040-Amphidinium_carterae.1
MSTQKQPARTWGNAAREAARVPRSQMLKTHRPHSTMRRLESAIDNFALEHYSSEVIVPLASLCFFVVPLAL